MKTQATQVKLDRLVGSLPLGKIKWAALEADLKAMRELGYTGVYFNDIFFTIVPKTSRPDPATIIFTEDDGILVYRPVEELRRIKTLLDRHRLTAPSAHFMQVLPPPGEKPEWIFPIHERFLDMAQAMGMQRVTTHAGWMFGAACERYLGHRARQFLQGQLPIQDLFVAAQRQYGRRRLRADTVAIYRQLCDAAARRGIQITIETSTLEWYDLTNDIGALLRLRDEVGADNLGICVDSGHCFFNGLDPAAIIRRTGGRMLETHFHDNFGDRDRHNPVGIGTINWLAVIQAMREIGYAGEITFEQGDYETNARNWRLFLKQQP